MPQSALSLPAHLAIIMDGNGRWASQRGAPRTVGHLAGARALRTIVTHCATVGVPQLTLYAFSSDNWYRPADEVKALLALFTKHFRSQAAALARADVRLSVIGRRDRLPLPLLHAIQAAEQSTAAGTRMHVRVAIDYSSRAAMAQSCEGAHHAAAKSESTLLPPVDLLLRTGGERRLSDFLLWECAYAELLFLDVLWPDMSPRILDEAFADYAHRDRRFGGLSRRASA
ncbi:MAG TPA: polyprenyl diphosphate synthase [Gemmatimonadaceae bacterium]|nr:polyprenyl diphosphate synthase [Gemmatimonadaceae bacterium]